MRDDVAFWCVWCRLSRAAPAHLRAARHLLDLQPGSPVPALLRVRALLPWPRRGGSLCSVVFSTAHSANLPSPGQSILMMMQIFEPSFLGRAIFPHDASRPNPVRSHHLPDLPPVSLLDLPVFHSSSLDWVCSFDLLLPCICASAWSVKLTLFCVLWVRQVIA